MDAIPGLMPAWQAALDGDFRGVFALIFFALAIPLAGSVIYQLRIRAWPEVAGRLIESSARRFGVGERVEANVDYVNVVAYEYTVAGELYEGRRLSPWVIVASHNLKPLLDAQRDVADDTGRVTVYYNPARPHQAFLRRPGLPGVLLTAGCAAFCLAVPGLLFA